jgi:hypothetical protein
VLEAAWLQRAWQSSNGTAAGKSWLTQPSGGAALQQEASREAQRLQGLASTGDPAYRRPSAYRRRTSPARSQRSKQGKAHDRTRKEHMTSTPLRPRAGRAKWHGRARHQRHKTARPSTGLTLLLSAGGVAKPSCSPAARPTTGK